jgi:hypothetical protein
MGVQHALQLMLVITELLNIPLSLNVQALMYPLLVACKSISRERKAAAQQVVDKVRQHSQHSGILVDQVTTSLTQLAGWLLMSNLCSFGCEQKTGFWVCLICCESDECTNRRRKKLFAGRAALHLCADWNCHAQRSESNAHNCFYDFMLNDCAGTTSVKGTHSGGNLVA